MNETLWTEVEPGAAFTADPAAWLAGQMGAGRPWLLAHADDGVIWGKLSEDGQLHLSSDAFDHPALAAPLRASTLLQVRVFGPAGELLIWRTDTGFAGREIADGAAAGADAYEETTLLWGRATTQVAGEFTVCVEDGAGQRHAPPLQLKRGQRARLVVRHYVDYDEHGQAYVRLSRLVKVQGGEE